MLLLVGPTDGCTTWIYFYDSSVVACGSIRIYVIFREFAGAKSFAHAQKPDVDNFNRIPVCCPSAFIYWEPFVSVNEGIIFIHDY